MTTGLKIYQEEALQELSEFLRAAQATDAARAFNAKRRPSGEYQPIPEWKESEAFPYVCVRIPTGGGKTLLAAHAVGRVCHDYVLAERQVVLWLAPSDAIVQQTLGVLRDRGSRARKALAGAFGGQVTILDVEEALSVTPAVLSGSCSVIVSTVQSWRVDSTDGRRVYQPANGDLMGHFDGASEKALAVVERGPSGQPVYSLGNVLRLRKPIVIIDEGHKFRTKRTFETLKRFSPRAVVEFTATPHVKGKDRVPSNVVVEKSARDLKIENMIKAPIVLRESKQWTDAVRLAVAKRKELARAAEEEGRKTGEYIRPIVLFKAEDNVTGSNNVTVDVLREHLIKEGYATEEEVVIHVGGRKDLPANILSPECPVNYVITVDALGEGWDCPFAYVLCTIATLSSSIAVEQILGRVLRMPNVTLKHDESLNRAYCFTSSGAFGDAATNLKDALVDAGFSRDEAEGAVIEDRGAERRDDEPAPLFRNREIPVFVDAVLSEEQKTAIASAVPGDVRFEPAPLAGTTTILYRGDMLDERAAARVESVLEGGRDKIAAKRFKRALAGEGTSASELGELFRIPALAIQDPHAEGGLSLFEAQHRETAWTLDECSHELGHFDASPGTVREFEVAPDEDGAWVDQYKGEVAAAVSWMDQGGPRTLEELSAWLDRSIEDRTVTQDAKRAYIDRVLLWLTRAQNLSVERLSPVRWRLARAIAARVEEHRSQIERHVFQSLLGRLVVSVTPPHPSLIFALDSARSDYPGDLRATTDRKSFPRHFFPFIGDMNNDERLCAQLIDAHPNTKHWIRNIERHPKSFWMPGLRQKFYPDFIAVLHDGRYAAIEYKGKRGEQIPDEQAKREMGMLWAARSEGKCVFVWVTKEDMEASVSAGLASPS
ncbi:MAG: DEAD/DEAH box helicase family protein [Phycisphaeraceae bacterium]|nr:MAG: DEAD/DEAH box helicase family protein [Phycisphaeraceae bacterium]